MPKHTIQQGDNLFELAAKNGLDSWEQILDHKDNRSYKQRRPDPGILYPGEVVFIPNKELGHKPSPVDQKSVFKIDPPTAWLRIAAHDSKGEPLADKAYKLEVTGDKTYEANLDGEGVLAQKVPVGTRKAKLTITLGEDTTRVWNLKVGWLDPIDTITGIQARLNNLGFLCGANDGTLNDHTKAALNTFKTAVGLEADGKNDTAFQKKLDDYYDPGRDEKTLDKKPPWPLYKDRVSAAVKRWDDRKLHWNKSEESKKGKALLEDLVQGGKVDKLRRAVSWLQGSSLLPYEAYAQLKTGSSLYKFLKEELERELGLTGEDPGETCVHLVAAGDAEGDKIRLPGNRKYGVVQLQIEASTKKSASTLSPESQPITDPATDGVKDLNFAPSLSTDKVKVKYKVDNPDGLIQEARLELHCRGKADAVWQKELAPKDYTDGEHTYSFDAGEEWNGKIDESEDFPDAYLTVERSPYELRLKVSDTKETLATDKDKEVSALSPVAWTDCQVLLKEIELELGDKKALSADVAEKKHRDLVDALASLPGEGASKEIKLISNLFTDGDGQMMNNTLYDRYEALWGDGPKIPIFAKLSVADSEGNKKDVPKALGKLLCLWDWESVAEDTSRHHSKAKTFLDKALDYDKANTLPKGDNCHTDRGGKRGKPSKAVFPEMPGYDAENDLRDGEFPFKVTKAPLKERAWAVASEAWREGAAAGKTGVLFQPSRMAGDAYKVTVYPILAWKENGDPALDVKDDAPLKADLKKATGTFEIWREVHMVRHFRKTTAVPAVNTGTVIGYYEKANLDLVDNTGGVQEWVKGTYDTRLGNLVNLEAWYYAAAVDLDNSQYDAGTHFIYFRSFADFKTKVEAHIGTALAANTWLTNNVPNENKYVELCEAWAMKFIVPFCDPDLHADDGVNIFQFQGLYNLENKAAGKLNGWAADMPSGSRSKCGFIACAGAGNYGGNSNTYEQTTTHEIGHHMFLPHTKDSGEKSDYVCHDTGWSNCTMSYNYDKERKFCGFCLLRLRGWDKRQLKVSAGDNRKR